MTTPCPWSINNPSPIVAPGWISIPDVYKRQVFTWPRNEHCAALSGYDIDRGVVTLDDPTHGIVERSMEEFVTYYQKYYYQAVVVR